MSFPRGGDGNPWYPVGGVTGTQPGISDIIIADRLTDFNQRRILGTTGLICSWELSHAGQLTCDMTLRDLAGYGYRPSDLLGKWLHYSHPTAGPWGGVITNISPADGIVTINAESWAIMYKGLLAGGVGVEPGGMIANLARLVDYYRPYTGIRLGYIDRGPYDPIVDTDFLSSGDDFYDGLLPKVTSRWNDVNGWQYGLQAAAWNVDPLTRAFTFDATYGTDRSATVTLLDGLHNTGAEWSDDMSDVVNWVSLGGSYNVAWTETAKFQDDKGKWHTQTITYYGTQSDVAIGSDAASIARYGYRQVAIDDSATLYSNFYAVQHAARMRALLLSRNQQLVTINCADVGGVWARFREGDVITAGLSMEGAKGRMLVRHRALDVTRGVMTVSGEAELQ